MSEEDDHKHFTFIIWAWFVTLPTYVAGYLCILHHLDDDETKQVVALEVLFALMEKKPKAITSIYEEYIVSNLYKLNSVYIMP